MLDTTDWVVGPHRATDATSRLVERFLLNSLAVGASRSSDGFIDAFGIANSSNAAVTLKKFEAKGFYIAFRDKAEDVQGFIGGRIDDGQQPWEGDEYYVCTRSEKSEVRDVVRGLREYQENVAGPQADESNKYVLRRFYELDSVFRHLRNSLAHGCFREVGDGEKVFFFDLNRKGDVSAAALLSVRRLDGWYEAACGIARKRL